MANTLYIFFHFQLVQNTLYRYDCPVTFVFNGIMTKIVIANTLGKKHAYTNTYCNTSKVRVTVVFLMTSPLPLLIKLILQILTNGNSAGDI